MVARPADLDPENFVIGKGSYVAQPATVPYADAGQFRIDPAPIPPFPLLRVVTLIVLYVTLLAGLGWFVVTHRDADVSVFEICAALTASGLIACIGTIAIPLFARWLAAREQARGPWLRYDKATRQVRLPREHLTFDLNEVVHLQYVTAEPLQNSRSVVSNFDRWAVSELNLVTNRSGKRERRNVLKPGTPHGAFEATLDRLVEDTPIPVVRITETAGPWKVWVRPYRDVTAPRLKS